MRCAEMKGGLSEAERRERLENLRPADAVIKVGVSWSDNDLDRLRAAFKTRFDEAIPRTETLMAVAAEGIRIFQEQTSPPTDTGKDE